MPAKIADPTVKGMHVQLSPKSTRKMIRITKKTRRSIHNEVEMAIEQYVPTLRYVDNGK